MDGIGSAILKGAIIGTVAAVLGWVKNSKPGKFSAKGLLVKLPTGILVGIVASTQEIEFTEALEWASGVGIVEVIDKAMKMVIRRFRPDWMSFSDLDAFKFDPEHAEVIMKITDGKSLTRDDVINGTEAFKKVSAALLDMNDPMDREFSEHINFAANQILQNVRKEGWSDETYENAGKILFRLFQVWRKYRTSKASMSAVEWANEMKLVVEAMQAVFEAAT